MGLNVEDVIAGLDPTERRKVEDLAAVFIAEEMTLRELRKARKLTQVSVARELGISQDAVSSRSSPGFPTVPRSNSPASLATRPAIEPAPRAPSLKHVRAHGPK